MVHDPDAVAAQEHHTWQASAGDYSESIAPFTAYSGQIPLLQELGRIEKGAAILELGSGTGDVSAQLAKLGCNIVGIDFSENMVKIASSRFPGLDFHVADAEDLPFSNDEFDLVASCYTAHHFARPDRVFSEAKRVLKPGGRVAVIMPVQSEQKSFGAFFESAREEVPPEDVPGGPLLDVREPEAVGDLLSGVGFVEVIAEKRLKPTRIDGIERVLRAGWSFMALDEHTYKNEFDRKPSSEPHPINGTTAPTSSRIRSSWQAGSNSPRSARVRLARCPTSHCDRACFPM